MISNSRSSACPASTLMISSCAASTLPRRVLLACRASRIVAMTSLSAAMFLAVWSTMAPEIFACPCSLSCLFSSSSQLRMRSFLTPSCLTVSLRAASEVAPAISVPAADSAALSAASSRAATITGMLPCATSSKVCWTSPSEVQAMAPATQLVKLMPPKAAYRRKRMLFRFDTAFDGTDPNVGITLSLSSRGRFRRPGSARRAQPVDLLECSVTLDDGQEDLIEPLIVAIAERLPSGPGDRRDRCSRSTSARLLASPRRRSGAAP